MVQVSIQKHSVSIDDELLDVTPHEVRKQVRDYLNGERQTFDVSITWPDSFTGTVMAAMHSIPYGETRTYGEIARSVGSSAIAVGQACGSNPVPILVPCHRVVASDGLGGYQYPGLKRELLRLEGAL
jgi:methylated-DNA-[protein]-cysteine S-methyltransferase